MSSIFLPHIHILSTIVRNLHISLQFLSCVPTFYQVVGLAYLSFPLFNIDRIFIFQIWWPIIPRRKHVKKIWLVSVIMNARGLFTSNFGYISQNRTKTVCRMSNIFRIIAINRLSDSFVSRKKHSIGNCD